LLLLLLWFGLGVARPRESEQAERRGGEENARGRGVAAGAYAPYGDSWRSWLGGGERGGAGALRLRCGQFSRFFGSDACALRNATLALEMTPALLCGADSLEGVVLFRPDLLWSAAAAKDAVGAQLRSAYSCIDFAAGKSSGANFNALGISAFLLARNASGAVVENFLGRLTYADLNSGRRREDYTGASFALLDCAIPDGASELALWDRPAVQADILCEDLPFYSMFMRA
jgi:hypothetical protein